MIYVLLDTNIIIDMVVDRRNMVKNNVLSSFIKLLEYDEIKLIVPEIVKTETYRHLENELLGVEDRIKSALDTIKNLYGVSTLKTVPLDLTQYKKNAREELNKALTTFTSNKEAYKDDIFYTINLLFSHRNTIIINDLPLIDKVLKRKIYKKAPFHKIEKESNGDGVITETLINIKDFVTIVPGDIFYFVTGNYTDFSSSNDRNELHKDILEDLEKQGLACQVKYIRDLKRLVMRELSVSLSNASQLEELQKELEYEEEENKRQYEKDMIDLDRESFGMSSLSSFVGQIQELLSCSDFADSMTVFYSDFISVEDEISNLICQYYDLIEEIKEKKFENLTIILKNAGDFFEMIFEDNYSGVSELIRCIEEKTNMLEGLSFCDDFEILEFDNRYHIYSPEQECYTMTIDKLLLQPSSGEKDEIDIVMESDGDNEKYWNAYIEVSYGDAEVNEDGGVGNAYEEYCVLIDNGIISQIQDIISRWKEYLNYESKVCSKLYSIIDNG